MSRPDPVDRDQALAVAVAAARAGAAVLAATDRRTIDVAFKQARVDLTTSADRASQDAAARAIRAAFAAHTIVGEEGTEPGPDTEHAWYVDGLDGTSNFANGLPWYCVSVALRERDEVVAGAVVDPVHDELFAAARGRGATCNGVPLRVPRGRPVERTVVATQIQSADPARIAAFAGELERLLLRTGGVRFLGAPALLMSHVAAGHLGAYAERAMEAWDISAGQLIVEEAGGRVTDWTGTRIATADRTDVLASDGGAHEELLAILRAP